jgi:hypothetical protein
MKFKQPEAFDFRWTVVVVSIGFFLMAVLVATLLYLFTYRIGPA